MPAGSGYTKDKTPGVPSDQRRSAAGKNVSYNNKNRSPMSGPSGGKFAGLKGGPSGGSMNTGGKKRPGSRTVRGMKG